MEYYEKQITTKTVYEGVIVNIKRDKAEIKTGKQVTREVVEHPGGVAIVPVTDEGKVLMVRQYRYAMREELLEIPAGKLSKGEDHYDCAVRELSEETGCTAGKMTYLGRIYSTPGFCSEVLHLYLATDLEYGEMHLDEDELLSVTSVSIEELVEKIMSNEIPDGKTMIGILKAEKHLKDTGSDIEKWRKVRGQDNPSR